MPHTIYSCKLLESVEEPLSLSEKIIVSLSEKIIVLHQEVDPFLT